MGLRFICVKGIVSMYAIKDNGLFNDLNQFFFNCYKPIDL